MAFKLYTGVSIFRFQLSLTIRTLIPSYTNLNAYRIFQTYSIPFTYIIFVCVYIKNIRNTYEHINSSRLTTVTAGPFYHNLIADGQKIYDQNRVEHLYSPSLMFLSLSSTHTYRLTFSDLDLNLKRFKPLHVAINVNQ